VKPKNILLTKDGVAKLTDLGLARAMDDKDAAETEAGKAYGTPYYISPEQIRGDVDIDFRADIYSLGATMYHLVTGKPPFDGETPSAVMHKHLKQPLTPADHVNTALSAGIGEIIDVAMAKNRERSKAYLRKKLNKSVLDGITRNVSRIMKDLDAQDRNRLNAYLENVREIERRIQAIEAYNASNPTREVPTAPIGVPDSWDEHVRLMMDLIALGFAAETTRVATLKLGRDTSNRVFPESGSTTPFHSASHHQDVPSTIMDLAWIKPF